jgi:proteasome lid subunit RPN8/RPN11
VALGLPRALRAALVAHLRGCLPGEGCGFLVRDASGGVRFVPARNVDPDPTRGYTVEPIDLIDTFRQAQAAGGAVTGVVHSHPRTPARPSDRDARQWFYPELLMVVVSFADGRARVRGWLAAPRSPRSPR